MGTDYSVIKDIKELKGSGYYQICPGKFNGRFWQQECVFVREDVFGVTEGIIYNHYPNYNSMGINDIPKALGLEIAASWEKAASELLTADSNNVLPILFLEGEYGEFMFEDIMANKVTISKMLGELAIILRDFYETNDLISILGI